MKPLTKTVLAALALFSSLTMWSNDDPALKQPTRAGKTIHDYFRFPSVLLPAHSFKASQPVKVEVLYATDTTGKVNFVLARTGDRQLKQEIEKQFSALTLQSVPENVVHKVVLSFKVI